MKRSLATLTAAALALWPAAALARGEAGAQDETAQEVHLEAAELTVKKDTIAVITQQDMQRKTADNLMQALKHEAGVYQYLSSGRGEEGVLTIRGSNQYQVGLYIDDIPIATAYRNEFDYNNILTFDLESVEVSKGYSSPLLASNNGMAGVVNVRTAKPTQELEFKLKYMNYFDRKGDDQGYMTGASIGTKQDLFYLKATIAQFERDFYTLSSSYKSTAQQSGGRRVNSDSKNRRLNFIAGLTPTEDVDIMFGYVNQDFDKGHPPDANGDPSRQGTNNNRMWRWPDYKTERYYVNASVGLTDKAKIKVLGYYDKHEDRSEDYTGISYHQRQAAGQWYDQYTAGAQVKFDYEFNEANKLAASVGYRELSHKNKREARSVGWWEFSEEIVEEYWDYGLEYSYKPIEQLTLVAGGSYTDLTPKTNRYRANSDRPWGDMPTTGDDFFNYQLGAFYDIAQDQQLFFTFAKKNRIGTMRERYSASNNQLTNPDLKPESAFHYEFGYRGVIDNWLSLNASIYHSAYRDKIIQTVRSPRTFGNVDKAKISGLEVGLKAEVNEYLTLGGSMSHMRWRTEVSDAANEYLTHAPKWQGAIYAVVKPVEGLSIIPQLDFTGAYYSDSGSDTEQAAGFATADLKAVYDFNDHFSVEIGAKNIFDKYYCTDWERDSPQEGRSFFIGGTYTY